MIRVLCRALLCCLLAAGVGCGAAKPKQYSVSGKVTVGGKPLADVAIFFVPASGAQDTSPSSTAAENFSGKTGADGSYKISNSTDQTSGAQAGKYKVVLQLAGDDLSKRMMESMKAPGQGGPPKVETPFPPEYTSAATSPKEVEVKSESNTIDITIP